MKKVTGNSAQLIDDLDAEVSGDAIHFLLRLRVQSQPGRLQGIGQEETVGRVQRFGS